MNIKESKAFIELCEVIRHIVEEVGSVPSGQIYALSNLPLSIYESAISILVDSGQIKKNGDLHIRSR